MQESEIIQRTETRLSPWSSIIARSLVFPRPTGPESYHALWEADYVNVLAVTRDGRVTLVRGYHLTLGRCRMNCPVVFAMPPKTWPRPQSVSWGRSGLTQDGGASRPW